MPIVTERNQALEVIDRCRDKKVSMAIFCTASHWNTEAILLAASRYAEKNGIENISLAVAMTFNYKYMPQSRRVTYAGDAATGFVSIMEHLKSLCGSKKAPYGNVTVLPHLDHADPVKDKWALTEGLPYLASVMFDAQKYPIEDNIAMTKEYVSTYGKNILIEGIMEELGVEGNSLGKGDDLYIEKALAYFSKTNIDFLVADLGTEQQSLIVGKCVYKKDRAGELTRNLGKEMLVLHGTSCLTDDQMTSLAQDGVIRVNMWTRIAREAGQYAAGKLVERYDEIRKGSFEASESRQYIFDSIEKAADIMEETMHILGYSNLKG
ncbi:MAG: class II fructose-bisphosphate aldolase [Clostridiales bacterium]|nr:class II fructose-bisphosphate aldolase [Clostridiales bacterium]